MRKIFLAAIAALVMLSSFITTTQPVYALEVNSDTAEAVYSGWKKTAKGWAYYQDGIRKMSGTMKIEGRLYYFRNGYTYTGWYYKNGIPIYYFNPAEKGAAASGWVVDSKGHYRYFDTKTGVMATGWLKDSAGNYRYFDKKTGYMKVGIVNGVNGIYYFKTNGIALRNCTAYIGGRPYKFKNNCLGVPVRGEMNEAAIGYY